eukprot:CAMPEP_0197859720 /NCGR_PEP_ID=MMETSP1438-20131217/34544_1 /TAXON_ID=1461541 /ORGANISM="Pterosperma sp., Strain CCMP1384" /LENGTH=77 /DNA_ID=CAMNT_0043476335 /DNA_START=32 /DNA_END=262 /DNA_ORIENTATION=+
MTANKRIAVLCRHLGTSQNSNDEEANGSSKGAAVIVHPTMAPRDAFPQATASSDAFPPLKSDFFGLDDLLKPEEKEI